MDLRRESESSTGFADYSSAAVGGDIIALAQHVRNGEHRLSALPRLVDQPFGLQLTLPRSLNGWCLSPPFVRAHSGDGLQKAIMNLLLARPWGAAFWMMYFPKFYPRQKPEDFETYRGRLKANLREARTHSSAQGYGQQPRRYGRRTWDCDSPNTGDDGYKGSRF